MGKRLQKDQQSLITDDNKTPFSEKTQVLLVIWLTWHFITRKYSNYLEKPEYFRMHSSQDNSLTKERIVNTDF